MKTTTKRGFLLARGWIQAVILVFLFGFFVLGFLAYRTYTDEPPIPGKVVDPDGHLLFTRANIMARSRNFPPQWPDGVWIDFWSWRIPWA
jgi:nitric oxide reductase subunit B